MSTPAPPLRLPAAARPGLRAALALLMTLLGCGEEDAVAPAGPPPARPALVEVAQSEPGALDHPWETLGEVYALGDAALGAGAAGPVLKVSVREGDRVERGQVLVQIDDALAAADAASAQAAVDEATASLELSRTDLGRLGQVEQSVLAGSELDRAQAAVKAQEARLAALTAQSRRAVEVLGRHTVRAPFTGVVTVRRVDPGDWVQVGQGVVDLVSVEDVEVRTAVSAEVAGALRAGAPAEILGPGVAAPAEIVAVVPVLAAPSRTALVRLRPTDRPAWLVPGAPVSARFSVHVEVPTGARVPRDALVLGPTSTRVVRAVDGKAEPVEVTVVATSGDEALVTGIAVGETLVVRGNERVRPGQELQISTGAEALPPGAPPGAAPETPAGAGTAAPQGAAGGAGGGR